MERKIKGENTITIIRKINILRKQLNTPNKGCKLLVLM